ncbi:MAG: hypothetical protein J6C99_04800 [Lachnospiraceae bacterium]|nr:hypothetical protein [Lachnospiraceae bacterium]
MELRNLHKQKSTVIMKTCLCIKRGGNEQIFELRKWLNAQRYKKSVGKLKEKYIILLDEIGMNWEKPLRG